MGVSSIVAPMNWSRLGCLAWAAMFISLMKRRMLWRNLAATHWPRKWATLTEARPKLLFSKLDFTSLNHPEGLAVACGVPTSDVRNGLSEGEQPFCAPKFWGCTSCFSRSSTSWTSLVKSYKSAVGESSSLPILSLGHVPFLFLFSNITTCKCETPCTIDSKSHNKWTTILCKLSNTLPCHLRDQHLAELSEDPSVADDCMNCNHTTHEIQHCQGHHRTSVVHPQGNL